MVDARIKDSLNFILFILYIIFLPIFFYLRNSTALDPRTWNIRTSRFNSNLLASSWGGCPHVDGVHREVSCTPFYPWASNRYISTHNLHKGYNFTNCSFPRLTDIFQGSSVAICCCRPLCRTSRSHGAYHYEGGV